MNQLTLNLTNARRIRGLYLPQSVAFAWEIA